MPPSTSVDTTDPNWIAPIVATGKAGGGPQDTAGGATAAATPLATHKCFAALDAGTATRLDCHDVGTPLVGTIPAAVGDLSLLTYFAVHGPS